MNKTFQKKNKLSNSRSKNIKQILNNINADSALEILKKLADEDINISEKIEELALGYLTEVNPDSIAENIFNDLNSLEVEEVWDNSGSTRDGYIAPYELASEMFEETLETYLEELRKYQKLSMNKEAKLTCMGILKGLYMFKKKATTEFKGYVEDDPYTNFTEVFEEWAEMNKDPKIEKNMYEFVIKNFPEWSNVLKNK
ncbi:MAG TPA: hypothetical protein VMR41_03335 [Patescibacteria group bacterium]|nr:hypothetical protein [Patescibacteria group bacterium]